MSETMITDLCLTVVLCTVAVCVTVYRIAELKNKKGE